MHISFTFQESYSRFFHTLTCIDAISIKPFLSVIAFFFIIIWSLEEGKIIFNFRNSLSKYCQISLKRLLRFSSLEHCSIIFCNFNSKLEISISYEKIQKKNYNQKISIINYDIILFFYSFTIEK